MIPAAVWSGVGREVAGAAALCLGAVGVTLVSEPATRFLSSTPRWPELAHAVPLGFGLAFVASLLFRGWLLARARTDTIERDHSTAYRSAQRGWGPAFAAMSKRATPGAAVAGCAAVATTQEGLLRGGVVALEGTTGSVPAVAAGAVLALVIVLCFSPAPRETAHRGCVAMVLALAHGWLALRDTSFAALVVSHAVLLLLVHRA